MSSLDHLTEQTDVEEVEELGTRTPVDMTSPAWTRVLTHEEVLELYNGGAGHAFPFGQPHAPVAGQENGKG